MLIRRPKCLGSNSHGFLKNNFLIKIIVSYRALIMNGKALQKRSTIRQTSQAQRVEVCLLGFCPLHSACQARFGTSFPSLGSTDSISTVTSSGFCSGVTADSIACLLAVNPKATESLLPEGTLLENREPCQTARIPHGHFLQGQTSKY